MNMTISEQEKNVSNESKWTKVSKEDSENFAGVGDDGE